MDMILQNLDFVVFLVLLTLGYLAGSRAERLHYQSIQHREQALLNLPVVTWEDAFPDWQISGATMVTGSAVISIDYFKRLMAILRNLFGGRVTSYESLVDRARREAILRMKQSARELGADMILNMRLETSAIGQSANSKRQVGSVEAIAYGTAIIRRTP
jgi:uncharacterized protein YbjQ (UPF0145 family)